MARQIITMALERDVFKLVEEVIRHEDSVIDYIFSGVESINDITADQLKTFIRSRANDTLELLGYNPYFVLPDTNPIAEWFYQGANSIKMHDFFVSGTNQYRRSWQGDSFSRLPFIKGDSNEQ